MLYNEALPYLKDGMRIRIISLSKNSSWDRKFEGEEFFIDSIDSRSLNCQGGPVIYRADKFEILTNPDGTPWVHPDKAKPKFKVGDRVRIIRNTISPTERGNWSGQGIGYTFTIDELNGKYAREKSGESSGVHIDLLEKLEDKSTWKKRPFEEAIKIIYKPNESMTQKVSRTMNSIVKKIKDLKLSEEDRILRKHGFEDEDGKMTPEADDLMDTEVNEERWKQRRTEIAADLKLVEQSEK